MAFSRTSVVVILLLAITVIIGFVWDWRRWLIAAGAFFGPFIVLYTTLFTNGQGIATGLVGSLGYWLAQHGVERGSQPLYYYILVQIPIYEFLPAIGALIVVVIGLKTRFTSISDHSDAQLESANQSQDSNITSFPIIPFIAAWALSSLIIYSFAGERMPWLTVHIALPLILLAGWGIGRFLDSIDWRQMRQAHGWIFLRRCADHRYGLPRLERGSRIPRQTQDRGRVGLFPGPRSGFRFPGKGGVYRRHGPVQDQIPRSLPRLQQELHCLGISRIPRRGELQSGEVGRRQ